MWNTNYGKVEVLEEGKDFLKIRFLNTGYEKTISKNRRGSASIRDDSLKGVRTRARKIWEGIVRRVGKKHYHDVLLCKEWEDFETFYKDLKDIPGYEDWIQSEKNEFHLDKDYLSGDVKIYSKDTCAFISRAVNLQTSVSEVPFLAVNTVSGETELFYNYRDFCRRKEDLNEGSSCRIGRILSKPEDKKFGCYTFIKNTDLEQKIFCRDTSCYTVVGRFSQEFFSVNYLTEVSKIVGVNISTKNFGDGIVFVSHFYIVFKKERLKTEKAGNTETEKIEKDVLNIPMNDVENKMYYGKNLRTGKEYYFSDQKIFAEEHGLQNADISACMRGRIKSHKGWIFINHTNEKRRKKGSLFKATKISDGEVVYFEDQTQFSIDYDLSAKAISKAVCRHKGYSEGKYSGWIFDTVDLSDYDSKPETSFSKKEIVKMKIRVLELKTLKEEVLDWKGVLDLIKDNGLRERSVIETINGKQAKHKGYMFKIDV